MIALIFLCISLVHAQCDIPPLTLAWTNTTVTQDGLGVTRGVAMGIGSPQQIFALRPYTQLNNTRVNNIADCSNVSNDTCIGGEGGVFNSSMSSTYSVTIKGNWNGSQVDSESSTGSYVYFNDKITYQSQATVNGFPVVMDSEPQGGSFSGLPIGTNSSFLDATFKGGAAPSEVVGLWSGSRSLSPVDGLMVVGGYDAARVNGSFQSFNISKATTSLPGPLQVNITGLEFAGSSLLNANQVLQAVIEPYTQRFVFTSAVAQKFGNITAQDPVAYPNGMQYPAGDYPAGDLTITLSTGYKTTITNNELFTILRGSDSYGRYAITNNTVIEAGIADNRASAKNGAFATLGGLFLTFNYLMIDYHQGNFSLAPAKSSTATPTPNIKTVCTPTATPSNSTTPAAASTSSSSNAGAIAGGVVGGVVGAALIAGLIWFFVWRRRKQAAAKQPDGSSASEKDGYGPGRTHRQPSELESHTSPTSQYPRHGSDAPSLFSPMTWKSNQSHEMPGDHRIHEMPGYQGVAEMEAPLPSSHFQQDAAKR